MSSFSKSRSRYNIPLILKSNISRIESELLELFFMTLKISVCLSVSSSHENIVGIVRWREGQGKCGSFNLYSSWDELSLLTLEYFTYGRNSRTIKRHAYVHRNIRSKPRTYRTCFPLFWLSKKYNFRLFYRSMCSPLELPICKGSGSWLSFISDLQSASVLCSTTIIVVINVALLLLYSTPLADIYVLKTYYSALTL